jgi:hypothetical protein
MKKTFILFLLSACTMLGQTQLQPAYCNYTAKSFGEIIYATSVPGVNKYRFTVSSTAASYNQTFDNVNPAIAFYILPGSAATATGITYTVNVATSTNNGASWSAPGPDCDLSSPGDYTTTLVPGDAGAVVSSWSQLLSFYPMNPYGSAQQSQYQVRLTNISLGYSQVVTKYAENFSCSLFTGLAGSTVYTVEVRADYPAAWSNWGPATTITTPAAPATSLQSGYCGITASSYQQILFAEYAPGTQFQYKLENAGLGYSQTFIKTNTNFNLAQFTSLQHNTTYSVSVAVFYNGAWGPYGAVCQLTTPGAPTTSMQPGSSGITASSYQQVLFAEYAPGTQFRYNLENAGLGYSQTFVKTNTNFNLAQFTGLQNNTTYSVSVGVFYNGSWGPYGNVTQVTTPGAPTSSIISGECGATASSYTSQLFHAEQVDGATCYFYNFTDGVNTYTLEKCINNNFSLDQLSPQLPVGTTFTVTVKVQYNGSYGPFGGACTLTTPGSFMRPAAPGLLYPNPFSGSFSVSMDELNADEPMSLQVLDGMGNVIETRQINPADISGANLGKDWPVGLYHVFISQGGSAAVQTRIIKTE